VKLINYKSKIGYFCTENEVYLIKLSNYVMNSLSRPDREKSRIAED